MGKALDDLIDRCWVVGELGLEEGVTRREGKESSRSTEGWKRTSCSSSAIGRSGEGCGEAEEAGGAGATRLMSCSSSDEEEKAKDVRMGMSVTRPPLDTLWMR